MAKHIKYPRTPHIFGPSENQKKEELIANLADFRNKKIVVTEKMDGQNHSLYHDGLHARSLDSAHHPSQSWIKAKHAQIAPYIPYTFRICGENMYAKHSIEYTELKSYFYVFSIWNGEICMDWDYTVQWAEQYQLAVPRVFWIGIFNEEKIRKTIESLEPDKEEGIVIRGHGCFRFHEFRSNVAKWVRPDHVQTDNHWTKNWTKNKLKGR